jgi:hypothetical protein
MNVKILYFLVQLKFFFNIAQNFQKDLDTNIQFPPLIERKESIPTGHLRPLGWQIRSDGPLTEESSTIRPEEFWDLYVIKKKPTVMRGLVFGADAIDNWSDSYLNRKYGHLKIKVTERKQRYSRTEENKTEIKFSDFLKRYRSDDLYMKTIVPADILNELPVPQLINCGVYVTNTNNHDETNQAKIQLLKNDKYNTNFFLPRIAQLVEPHLWISAGDTSSLIHSHPHHNLHCLLDGRKDFIIIPAEQFSKHDNWMSKLDIFETYAHSAEFYSKIDTDKINVYKFKILSNIKWNWASLRAGDCIFIPSNYFHQIRSHGRSISTSIYFNNIKHEIEHEFLDQIKKKLFSKCEFNAPLFETSNLIEKHFVWKYTHNERHLVSKEFDENDVKNYLLLLIHENDEFLYFEQFDHFLQEITSELKENIQEFKPNTQNLIALNSTQIWNDFFDESMTSSSVILNRKIIYDLKFNTNLERFTKILKISANFHDLSTGRQEL